MAKVERKCVTCGKSIWRYPSQFAEKLVAYCTRTCRPGRSERPAVDRFWEKVNKNGPPPAHRPELGPCWEWTGSLSGPMKYGAFRMPETNLAHRASWLLSHGRIPEGLNVLHHCDNPRCVRPDHLFLGTQSENIQDCANKGRLGNQKESKNKGANNGMTLHPERRPRGSNHGRSKTNEAGVLEVRAWSAQGMKGAETARRKGLSPSNVLSIIARKTWTHVP